jgi:hypothetical protein
MNGCNLNNARSETIRTFREKEEISERKNELETGGNNKNIRDLYTGINEFMKDYKPKTDLVTFENGNLLAHSHNILNR